MPEVLALEVTRTRAKTRSGHLVAVIRAPPGTRKTILSADPWSQKHILSAPVRERTTEFAHGIQLPKLNLMGGMWPMGGAPSV